MSDSKNKINGYNLTRDWFAFKYENVHKCKPIHTDMYLYIVDLWNRLGQKNTFGLPTTITMEVLGIGSYNTYKKTYQDLIDFGFIKEIKKSRNQHQSRIVALSKNDKPLDKSLDKASAKAVDKSLDKVIDIIIEQLNKEQLTIEQYVEFIKDIDFSKNEKEINIDNQTTSTFKEKKKSKYFSDEVIRSYNSLVKYFPEELRPKKNKSWLETIDKLNRIDGHSFDLIEEVVRKTRNDNFWRQNFLSLSKLRNKNKDGVQYFLVFKTKFAQKKDNHWKDNPNSKNITMEELIEQDTHGH